MRKTAHQRDHGRPRDHQGTRHRRSGGPTFGAEQPGEREQQRPVNLGVLDKEQAEDGRMNHHHGTQDDKEHASDESADLSANHRGPDASARYDQ
jgi:hypothetical protein